MPFTRSQSIKQIEDKKTELNELLPEKSKKLKEEKSLSFKSDLISKSSKESFNRFGDDLSEVLLSFLTIEDKFRFECVSRQWQRLIFNRQYKVVLDFYEVIDKNTIKTPKQKQRYDLLFSYLFVKLKYLRDIECHHFFNTTTVESIVANCQYIQRFGFNGNMNINLFHQLFDKFGQKLIDIDLSGVFIKDFDNIFKFTPNLRQLKLNRRLTHLTEIYLPKLVDIMFPLNVCPQLLTTFTDKYFKQITKIHLRFDLKSSPEDINKCLNEISKYENLKTLTLTLRMTSKMSTPLDSALKLIGNKCKKLKNFHIKSSHFITNDSLLSVVNKFQSLVILKLYIQSSTNQSLGTVSELHSSQLKHITLEFNGLTDETFTDINIFIPNLISFRSNDFTNNNLTNNTLKSFSKLQSLRSLLLIGKHFSESGALSLIKNCPQINCLDINYDTTIKSVKAMIYLAISNQKIAYKLYVNLWPNKSLLKFNSKVLPINLSIIQKQF